MKNATVKSFLLTLMFGSALFFTGCAEDPCEEIDCGLNGQAVPSADEESCDCECDAGYEGEFCTVVSSERFVGNFDVEDMCDSDTYLYESVISQASADPTRINISNFAGYDETVVGDVDGTDLTITEQNIPGDITIVGDGTINATGDQVTITYTATDADGTVDNCTAVFTRL